jgi:hypothetical protein
VTAPSGGDVGIVKSEKTMTIFLDLCMVYSCSWLLFWAVSADGDQELQRLAAGMPLQMINPVFAQNLCLESHALLQVCVNALDQMFV